MVSSRREELLRLAEEAGTVGGEEAPRTGKEEGFPGDLFLEPKAPSNVPPPIETRVKPPKEDPKAEKPKPEPRKRVGSASERELQAVGDNLEEKIAVIFGLASGLAPVTSVYAVENSPKAISALLDIAKRRPAVLKALTKVADGADALEIAKFVLGILVCIQVDTGRLQGDELPARAFGVTAIIQENFVDNEGIIPTVNPTVTKAAGDGLKFSTIG